MPRTSLLLISLTILACRHVAPPAPAQPPPPAASPEPAPPAASAEPADEDEAPPSKADYAEAQCKAFWNHADAIAPEPHPKPYAERRDLCHAITVPVAMCVAEAKDRDGFDACTGEVTKDECAAIVKQLAERWKTPQTPEQTQHFLASCSQSMLHAEYACFMNPDTFPYHCQDAVLPEESKAPKKASGAFAQATASNELALCADFWTHLAKIAPDVEQPATEALRIEKCRNIDYPVEQCVNHATDRASYSACMHRLTPKQCDSLVATVAKRFGEDQFPPEKQANIRKQCPDVFVKATYDCLMDSTMGLWTCTHTIVDDDTPAP